MSTLSRPLTPDAGIQATPVVKEATAGVAPAKVRICPCGAIIVGRGPQAMFCAACAKSRHLDQDRRYGQTLKGRLRTRRYVHSPKKKLAQAAWADAHPQNLIVYRRRTQAQRPPKILTCAVIGCENKFIRGLHQSRKRLCDPCHLFYYGKRKHRMRLRDDVA